MLLRYTAVALLSTYNALAANDTESTSTLTLQSFVTVTASPTATNESSSNGLGDYIMQGLSGSNTKSSTAQALPAPATIAPFPTNSSTAAVGWEACQTSQVSWSEAWTSAYQPEVVTLTETYTNNADTITFNVTLGNADIYTTIGGIPHARGNLTATATSRFVETYSETSKSTYTSTEKLNATFLNPSPNCTIAPSKCTALWQTYLGDHGLPTTFENATEPAITPMPTERPRCAVGKVTAICETLPQPSCVFSAKRVDLYYWPVVTAAPNASLENGNSSVVATQVIRNITMTSPSVYMIFDHLQAVSSTDLDMTCSKSTPLGATGDVSWLGGGAIRLVGGPYTNAVVSLDPTSLSSLVRDLGPVNTASVVSEIAHGGPSYDYWVNAVQGTGYNYDYQRGYYSSVLAKPVDFHNLDVPEAEAYYMNINGAPGCNRMGDHPKCSTIFDGEYRAQLLVPEQVRSLRPEWAGCYDPLFGALDPPIALTPAGSIVVPTPAAPIGLTPVDSIKLPEQTPAPSPGPIVTSNPSPTAIPDTKPSDESDDKPASDNTPASSDDTGSDDNPNSDDQPSSDDTPASDDTDNHPSSNDKPASNEQPDSDANSGHAEGPTFDSNDDSPTADEGSPTNIKSPDTPFNDDQGSSQSGDDGKQPQNALDVLSAAQQSEAAKETTLLEAGATDDPAEGNPEGEDNASGQQNEGDSNAAGSDPKNPPPTQVVDIDGTKHTIVAQNGAQVIDGTTLPTDGSPKTIDGQVVSAVNGGIIIGTETVRLGSGQSAGPKDSQKMTFTAHGQTFTASPASSGRAMVVDGTTISIGHAAATLHGATISAASDGLVVDGSTVSYADASGSGLPVVLTLGSTIATASTVSSGVFAIGTVTLTAGESGTTVSGHVVSAASTGIVVDGASTSPDASGTQGTQGTASGSQPDAPSVTVSGAAKANIIQWAVAMGCGLALVL